MSRVQEARQHPRFAVDLQVSVAIDERQLVARTRDISRSGLCLVAQAPLALDTEIRIHLTLAFAAGGFSEPLAVAGRVVWCTLLFGVYQIGVMFAGLDEERTGHLEMFVGLLNGTLTHSDSPDDEPTDERLDITNDDPFAP